MTAGEIAACLTTKLRAVETGGHHRFFDIFDDAGVRVARTKLSRSFRPTTQLGDNLIREIRAQLGLSRTSQLRELVDCTISREEYLDAISR